MVFLAMVAWCEARQLEPGEGRRVRRRNPRSTSFDLLDLLQVQLQLLQGLKLCTTYYVGLGGANLKWVEYINIAIQLACLLGLTGFRLS
jgi:hypothetical protein